MATRFYFPSAGAAAPVTVSPTLWTKTSQAGTAQELVTTPVSSSMVETDVTNTTGTPNNKTLVRQYVSAGMAAGIDFVTGHTITAQILGRETSSSANAYAYIHSKVVSEDGSSVQVVLNNGTSTKSTTELVGGGTATNVSISDTVATDYTTVAGDRLVVEVGIWFETNTGTTWHGWAVTGDDSGTDLPVDTTTTTQDNPWWEIETAVTFDSGSTAKSDNDSGTFTEAYALGLPVTDGGALAENAGAVDISDGPEGVFAESAGVNINTADTAAFSESASRTIGALSIYRASDATQTSGVPFVTQPIIALPTTTSGVTVTAALATGTGTLGGTSLTAVTDSNGRATFANLKITAGSGSGDHAIQYTATDYAAVTSGTISIASALAVQGGPSTVTSGVVFSPSPTVQLVDGAGVAVAHAGATVGPLKLSGIGTLNGSSAVSDSAGLLTFTDLSITDGIGEFQYRFVSSTFGLTSSALVVLDVIGAVSDSGALAESLALAVDVTPAESGTWAESVVLETQSATSKTGQEAYLWRDEPAITVAAGQADNAAFAELALVEAHATDSEAAGWTEGTPGLHLSWHDADAWAWDETQQRFKPYEGKVSGTVSIGPVVTGTPSIAPLVSGTATLE